MTVGRRGGRPIDVDGHALRWWFRRPPCGGCPQDQQWILIADASREGTVVRGSVPYTAHPEAVTPAFVAEVARAALARGWQPGVGSGEFR
jgi:hypothetical protein